MILDVTTNAAEINLMPSTELEEIAQNVRMIISTVRGSVPMDRNFGVDARLIDEPISSAQAKLTAGIATAIREQEPRARLMRVTYAGDPNDGQLTITARIGVAEKKMRGGVF